MAKTLMLTFSNPSEPHLDAEFHRWYTGTHIPQLLGHVPGMVSAARYRVVGDAMDHRYLVVYEIEGEIQDVLDSLAAGGADGRIERSPTLQTDPRPLVVFVEPIDDDGAPVTG